MFFRVYKTEIILFLGSLALGLSFLTLMQLKTGPEFSSFVLWGDALSYYNLAHNLKYFFSLSIVDLPSTPDAFLRTPGYPLFLALVLRLSGGSITAVFIVQIILSALSAVLVYKITNLIGFPKLVGVGAGLLFALEPNIAVYAVSIITEPLFVFIFLLFLYFLIKTLRSGQLGAGKFLSLGAILGFGVLVRPVLYPFIFILIALLAFYLWRLACPEARLTLAKNWLKLVVVFVVGLYLVVFPWILRNKIVFNSWSVSSISGVHSFLSYAVPFYAYKHGVNKNVAEEELTEKIKPRVVGDKYDLRNNELYKRYAREIISQDIPGYIFFHAINTTSFFLSNGYRNVPRDLGFEVSYPMVNLSFIRLVINRQLGVLWDFFKDHLGYLAVFVVGAVFWLLINLFMLVGIFRSLFKQPDKAKKYFGYLAVIAILYFAAVAGPEAFYKMRMPVNPFIFILAFYGLSHFLENHQFKAQS